MKTEVDLAELERLVWKRERLAWFARETVRTEAKEAVRRLMRLGEALAQACRAVKPSKWQTWLTTHLGITPAAADTLINLKAKAESTEDEAGNH